MATAANRYKPDYAVPPGWVLKERLDAQGISATELARRCGRSAKLISEILAGKAPIEPKTALQFEKVLGVDAAIWLGIETDHWLQQSVRPQRADDFDDATVEQRGLNRTVSEITVRPEPPKPIATNQTTPKQPSRD